jgi:beta-galactosidase
MTTTRRKFLQSAVMTIPLLPEFSRSLLAAKANAAASASRFLFGADVYPDIETPQATMALLDMLKSARMNIVRVAESSWGNLETSPGVFNFGWLHEFLDELEKRQMKAILGTSSFIPPQWLAGAHPEMLVVSQPGMGPSDPMSRKSPCLNHPLYREACRRYITAVGKEFFAHPAVAAWQLDNEIEFMVPHICYNHACDVAWRHWLEQIYHSPEEFNERLDLVSWGMKIDSFDEVPQPRAGVEEATPREMPALRLANYRFEQDTILDFLAEQAGLLRESGVKQEILTDWNPVWLALADCAKARQSMSIAGFNYYPSSKDSKQMWNDDPWHFDMHRSCYGVNKFLVTETRFGVMGDASIWDPAPTRDQFRMWQMELVAFGASGILYWTGNRWHGGHWPHWGGLEDWSGHAEPDFEWAVEMGRFLDQWGPALTQHPVKASAAVITDFNQRSALEAYPHIPNSKSVFTETFSALHRLGVGTDTITVATAADAEVLRNYSLVLLPAATAFDDQNAIKALESYVRGGGILAVLPFTAYMSLDGVFRGDGFAANLAPLTGSLVRTVRWMGSPHNGGKQQQHVQWSGRFGGMVTAVGLDGYCELLETGGDAETIAVFKSDQTLLDGRPAATLRKLGKGMALKLAFWPEDDSLLPLLERLIAAPHELLARALPEGVMAVPRTDGSAFVVNVTGQRHPLRLKSRCADRITSKAIETQHILSPYQVLWLERHA